MHALDFAAAEPLLETVLNETIAPLDCFVRKGSPLESLLLRHGFSMPDFFREIGPLVEWRRGETGDLGRSPRIQTLSWF